MFKLLRYLKDYKKETILAPAFKMTEALLELFVPVIMAAIIDIGIAQRDMEFIKGRCLMLIVLGVVGLLLAVTAQYFSAAAATGFAAKVRRALFAHVEQMSFANLEKEGLSTLITRMTSDINQVQTGVNHVLRLLLRSPFVVVGAMVMAFTIDVRMALIFVVVIPVLAVIIYLIMSRTIPGYRKVQEQVDTVMQTAQENLSGVRIIRAFGKEPEHKQLFHEKNETLARAQLQVGKVSGLLNPLTFVVVNLGIAAILYGGGGQVDAGRLTQGEVVALVNYMSQILVEMVKFANLIVTVTKAIACGNRIEAVLSGEVGMSCETIAEEQEKATDASEYAVEFQNVSFAYAGAARPCLNQINLKIKKGETIGIIGGTGAGKTSLVSLIPRFYDVEEGTVLVNGHSVKQYDPEELRKKIAVVMQHAALFRGTIASNLQWGKKDASNEQMITALKKAQAYDFVVKASEKQEEVEENEKRGLEKDVAQYGRNFSGGQRQRLSIARALVRQPEILILDDASSALDYATDAALRRALAELHDEMTIFIVAQRISSIQEADRIVVLDHGNVAGIGTHEELLKQCVIYQEIYDSQTHHTSEKIEGGVLA